MKYPPLPIIAALLALAPAPSAAQSPAVRDGAHDFDFSLGSWTTEVSIVADPFNKPDAVVHMIGTKVAKPIWGGKGWIEEVEAHGQGADWQGANVFLYDPAAGQWSQNFVDSSQGRMEIPSIGGWRDGKLEFYSQEFVGGKAMLIRGTWTLISKDQHNYEVARSNDGGRSWHTSFTALVSRAK